MRQSPCNRPRRCGWSARGERSDPCRSGSRPLSICALGWPCEATPPAPELFLNASGRPMTRVGFTYILRKHVSSAAKTCPSLREKRVSPHVLRHSCAMMIYQATGDLRKVSLWLGHAQMQTTALYLRADP